MIQSPRVGRCVAEGTYSRCLEPRRRRPDRAQAKAGAVTARRIRQALYEQDWAVAW